MSSRIGGYTSFFLYFSELSSFSSRPNIGSLTGEKEFQHTGGLHSFSVLKGGGGMGFESCKIIKARSSRCTSYFSEINVYMASISVPENYILRVAEPVITS